MGVVEEPIADGVGRGRVRQVVVPPLRRQLAGDDGRAGAGAVLEDLEDVAALGVLLGAGAQSSSTSTSTRASCLPRTASG